MFLINKCWTLDAAVLWNAATPNEPSKDIREARARATREAEQERARVAATQRADEEAACQAHAQQRAHYEAAAAAYTQQRAQLRSQRSGRLSREPMPRQR